ncbi:MYXO-CTERM sorting domain-containing protein [Nannocystis bainbridge]|uniref:MYXO-CTERM sorting domain-containing protein n=1 Tax=Nannocystis bainbridge TaxID=2995303 RepID=A0ABT5DU61_9BACT|nr:MYXO-CTERM sorting domain-containing protein [Nannocystis bainbridge]MDC0717161.1 MYXO-CTERM sorting domain-containing protein [Nannocystis bainbridge]
MALKADAILLLCGVTAGLPAVAAAADGERYDPYAKMVTGAHHYDMREVLQAGGKFVAEPVEQPDLSQLDAPPLSARASEPLAPGKLPEGWVQIGEVVQRREIAEGLKQVDPKPLPAWEDIEGNQYPRKGTVFLNFNGGILKSGADNSAESKSTLARHNHKYPVFNGSEATALTLIQAVQQDLESLGVRVLYLNRPSKTVPYTMAMIGGSWTDTNIGDPAGGVAPGTDCEDRDQRNVVYAFDSSSATISQEIAHAWGLDHTLGGDRIMSYQAGNNKHFGDNCQALCEEQCQGPGTIGCRLIHEIYCGEDSEQQNDLAELNKIFGTPEPDTEPPTVKLLPDSDLLELEVGESIEIKADIHDNYGGVGWRIKVSRDGVVALDEVDYDQVGAWYFTNLQAGVYEVVLEAEDHAEHVVQDQMKIVVGGASAPTTTDGGSEGEADTGDETAGVDDGSDTEDPGSASDGGTDGDSSGATDKGGCECRSSDQGAGGALVLPLLGLWFGHRARRRRTA